MTAEENAFQYAVWYWRHGVLLICTFNNEEEAADFAFESEGNGEASVVGVQRSDGKTETYNTWPAIQIRWQKLLEKEEVANNLETRKRIQVKSPFDDSMAWAWEGEFPKWVGRKSE